jgi:hypothetical protein
MFEKVEASDALKAYLKKWEGKPKEPTHKERAVHYSKILEFETDFFYETYKLSESAFNSIGDFNKERYHKLWAELRENGWRYFKIHEGDPAHWYCIYKHLIRKPTDREYVEVTIRGADIDDVFVQEAEE